MAKSYASQAQKALGKRSQSHTAKPKGEKWVCMGNLKVDGKEYSKGDEYTCEKLYANLLKSKSIVKVSDLAEAEKAQAAKAAALAKPAQSVPDSGKVKAGS